MKGCFPISNLFSSKYNDWYSCPAGIKIILEYLFRGLYFRTVRSSGNPGVPVVRECVRAGGAGSRTRRSLGHHLLHPLILRLLVLCAPAVLRPRALQDAPAPADPNS